MQTNSTIAHFGAKKSRSSLRRRGLHRLTVDELYFRSARRPLFFTLNPMVEEPQIPLVDQIISESKRQFLDPRVQE
jgi:hypothetical protein